MLEEPTSRASDTSRTDPEELRDLVDSDELLHSLGTPITIISGYVQLIRRRNRGKQGGEAEALERSLDAMEDALTRMREVVLNRRDGQGEPDNDDERPAT